MKNFKLSTHQYNRPKSRRGLIGFLFAILLFIHAACGQTPATLTDIVNAPGPGPFDISQLSNSGNQQFPGNLNYYDNNSQPPGQTFATGTNSSSYNLSTLAIQTGGLGSYSGIGTPQSYYLYIYSMSGNTATLLTTYVSGNVTFNDGDWLQWSGLTNILTTNTTYAYSFQCRQSVGYEAMGVASGNPYVGGQMALIPTAGGTINTGNAGSDFDATFNIGVNPPGVPAVIAVSLSPTNSAIYPAYAGTPVLLNVTATGTAPLYYIWQTDNGSGGATFSDISGAATDAVYTLDTTSISPGTYQYRVVVSNNVYAVTSGIVSLNLASASAPFILADTTIQPASAYVGGSVQLGATFDGTRPISYQWQFVDTNNDPAVAIAGATNVTLTLTNVQFSDLGSYFVVASNAVSGSSMVSSSPMTLTVLAEPQSFCIDFAYWNSSASGEGLYAGPGVIGNGTYWNQITGDQFNQASVTGLADDGATDLNIGIQAQTSNWSTTSSGGNPLLESWMITYNIPQSFTFNNVPKGTYNLVLYGIDGSYANQTELFTVNGVSLEATNHTYTSFVADDNYVIFTNIISTDGTITGTYQGATGGEGDFNGAQLQLVSTNVISHQSPGVINIALSGTTLTINGTNGVDGETYVLLESTNVALPLNQWTPVATNVFAGSDFSLTNAVNPSATQNFYLIKVP